MTLRTESTVYKAGEGGYHTYRIPSLLSVPGGALLAFAEGRRDGASDAGKIDILVRRSTDGGRSWSPADPVWADGANTCGNPCPVVDRGAGTVWLLMTHNLGCDKEKQIVEGASRGTRTVWVSRSVDGGLSWSRPKDITTAVKRACWTWYATGPGTGIQTASGRLVIPCDHMETGTQRYGSHVVLSDDHGASWRLGGIVPQDHVNECAVAETADGTLVLNMRNYKTERHHRSVSRSADGGETWTGHAPDPALPEPCCQAGLRSLAPFGAAGDTVLFSNPADTRERRALTVRISRDGARTWAASRLLHAGPSAYSCLEALPDGGIGCLYERGEAGASPYGEIRLAVFDADWISEGGA